MNWAAQACWHHSAGACLPACLPFVFFDWIDQSQCRFVVWSDAAIDAACLHA